MKRPNKALKLTQALPEASQLSAVLSGRPTERAARRSNVEGT